MTENKTKICDKICEVFINISWLLFVSRS